MMPEINFLCRLRDIIKNDLRLTDFACRFGGDEFSAIMPASSINDSFSIAKRIQSSMAKLASTLHSEIKEHLSASFGLAAYEAHAPISVADFFRQADLELYHAKKMGKNQISCDRVKGYGDNGLKRGREGRTCQKYNEYQVMDRSIRWQ